MIKVAVGIIYSPDSGQMLLCQRKRTARYPLKWEFPGGKLEENESPEEGLRRELKEELGIEATIGKLYHQQHAFYPDSGSFDVFYFKIPSYRGNIVNNVFESFQWVNIADLPSYDILEGNRDVVQKLFHDHEAHQSVKD